MIVSNFCRPDRTCFGPPGSDSPCAGTPWLQGWALGGAVVPPFTLKERKKERVVGLYTANTPDTTDLGIHRRSESFDFLGVSSCTDLVSVLFDFPWPY